MAETVSRVKRALKELLGREQWPKKERPRPRSFEEQIYASAVRSNDVCYDVGASTGDVSLFLARLAGDGGLVVAFEPVWPTYEQLCQRVQMNFNSKAPIVTLPVGLAETQKVASIQVPQRRFTMGSLAEPAAWAQAQQGAEIESFECCFLTLDGLRQSTSLPIPDFVKIDVEGAELFVLFGACRMFADGCRPLMLIELFAPWQRAFNYGPWKVLSWLAERGYRFLFACPRGLVEHESSEDSPFPAGYEQGYNLIAFHPSKHADRIKSLDGLRVGGGQSILPMSPPPVRNTLA
jgi:FkbM family methyltransferase